MSGDKRRKVWLFTFGPWDDGPVAGSKSLQVEDADTVKEAWAKAPKGDGTLRLEELTDVRQGWLDAPDPWKDSVRVPLEELTGASQA